MATKEERLEQFEQQSVIKPCPFCGGEVITFEPDADRNIISCHLGHAPMRTIEAWNTRTSERAAYSRGYNEGFSDGCTAGVTQTAKMMEFVNEELFGGALKSTY